MAVDTYRKRVATADLKLASFRELLVSQLDETDGGFDCWAGFLDWKTRVLLSDYLIQSVAGTAEALLSASLAAQEHREACFAESHAMRAAWRALESRPTRPRPDDYFAAIPRDAHAERRSHRATASAEHCLFHLGQTLDRLAAAIIIVGAMGVRDVATTDWGTVMKLQQAASRRRQPDPDLFTAPLILPPDTPGGELQRRLIRSTEQSELHGPAGWLSWMRDTRNAMTHRAPAVKMNVMISNGDMIRVFYRHPKWSEVQSFIYSGSRRPGQQQTVMRDQFVLRASHDVLDGLCESMTSMVAAICDSLSATWNDRRANPAQLVQHAIQWPTHEPRTTASSKFEGYSDEPRVSVDLLVANPSEGRRWSAARIHDHRWREWTE